MKKNISLLLLMISAVIFAQDNFQAPKLDHEKSWSIILIPDTQNYVKWNKNQPVLDLMVRWIEDNISSLNIKMVCQVGDLVEHNNILNQGYDGDQSADDQWKSVQSILGRLNGKVPYVAATGNHDFSINDEGRRFSRYNEFFPSNFNILNQKYLAQNFFNDAGDPSMENSVLELKGLNGKDYLFLSLEFAPRNKTLEWAKKVLDMPQYKNHKSILITHAFLNEKDKRTDKVISWFMYEPFLINNVPQKSASIVLPESNNGEQIWQKLIQPSQNLELVLSGHISGEGFRVDSNSYGKNVNQMLFDMQSEGGGHRNGNGGDGWLRIIEFYPDNKTVKVKTYSPLFGISPVTQQNAYKTDSRNEFIFKLSE
ncbi:MAG: metallophosphoesterase [Kaistella sp.]|nr:metallophosphoesterase [Kaistella sp.]